MNGQFTPIRLGPNGEIYAKLPAPSNPDVLRWQRMNSDGLSNRDRFMGGTPGKDSGVGLQVQDRMRLEGSLRGDGANRQVLGQDGQWHPINQTDMGHIEAAVDYWNKTGRYYGPRAPEVRSFMNDPKNYVLEPSGINRSNGASMGKTYLPPATEAEKNTFFNINDID
ncbi:HNH/ENDO VII superfamily nuclease [Fluviicoccus keumensis]|uniref:HNH/ENDO VII superfamily nuclease n=1 Tax=Fluviicoccus keumensis TaxID=1435465 RepID=A0A4Q7YMC7_9GAMM|nr:GH-E family nuclease [Fluviicoccus keumensis]RZU38478.1 HNH/ENDO VII superfamily nuclease [Fluviicoccus keumensis]